MAEEQEKKPNKVERLITVIPNTDSLAGIVTNKPEQVATLNAEAAAGNTVNYVKGAFDVQEKVGQIKTALKSMTAQVTSCPVRFLPADDSPRAKEIKEAVERIWKKIPNKNEALRDMVLARYYGFYLGQTVYADELEDNLWFVKSIDTIPLKQLIFRDENGVLNYPRLRTKDAIAFGRNLEPIKDQLIFHCVTEQGSCLLGGLARTLLWYGLFATFDTKAWITFAEVNGMPIRIGKLESGATDEEREAMEDALSNIGTDASGIIAMDSVIEFIESNKKSSSDVFKDLMQWITDTIDKIILGQTKTSSGDSGNRALGEVHERTLDTLTIESKTSLEETLQLQWVAPVTAINFGESDLKLAPRIEFVFESTKQKEAIRKAIKEAFELTAPIPLSFILKAFGIPEAVAGEDVVQKTDAAASDQTLVSAMDNLIASRREPASWLK